MCVPSPHKNKCLREFYEESKSTDKYISSERHSSFVEICIAKSPSLMKSLLHVLHFYGRFTLLPVFSDRKKKKKK